MSTPDDSPGAAFFRLDTDCCRRDVALEGCFSGSKPSACWLIGGGPSLSQLPIAEIAASPIPRMCLNLAGSQQLRPTFWTSYDPTARFHRSIYLDPGVTKFVHSRRAMDLVPETNHKVCDCPNLYFFEREAGRNYADFLSPQSSGIIDWRDSFVQGIDILYRLGFRRLYLAGCEMFVRPSAEQIDLAARNNVKYAPQERLRNWLRRCEQAGLCTEDLDGVQPGRHYHFAEWKPIQAAANTDEHYYRIVQHLRLSRRSLTSAGLQLMSVTPHSRLNEFFTYRPVRRVLREIARSVGDPPSEPVTGLYRQVISRHREPLTPMHDFPSPVRISAAEDPKETQPEILPGKDANDPELLVEYEQQQRTAIKPPDAVPPFLCEEG